MQRFWTDAEIVYQLKEIRVRVRALRAGLNVESAPCSGCGHTVHENWDHFKLKDALNAIETRCSKNIEELSRKESEAG